MNKTAIKIGVVVVASCVFGMTTGIMISKRWIHQAIKGKK